MSLPSYQLPHPRPFSLKRKLPPCMALSWCYFRGMVCRLPQIAGLDYSPSSVKTAWWRTWHAISEVLWQAALIVAVKPCRKLIKIKLAALFLLWSQTSSVGDTKARNRKMLLLQAFWFEESQHALLLFCAYRCAHLAAVNTLPQGGQGAKQ